MDDDRTNCRTGDASARTGHAPALVPLAYSVEQATRVTGLGRTTLYALMAKGCIPSGRIGRRRIILRAGLEAFILGQLDQVA